MSAEIFNLPTLKSLSIEYEVFNKQYYEWKLPPSMIKFRLSNSVFEYDLTECNKLSGLRLEQNQMTELPPLHETSIAFFRKLVLVSNPMNKLTVDDLARFCRIHIIEMHNVTVTDCECRKMKQWFKEWKAWADETENKFKFVGDLTCGTDTSE